MKITWGAPTCLRVLLGLSLIPCTPVCWLHAQITTGIVEGSVTDLRRHARTHPEVQMKRLPNGPEFTITTDARGRFTLVLPYGEYAFGLSGNFTGIGPTNELHLAAWQTLQCRLRISDEAGIAALSMDRPAVAAPPPSAGSLDLRLSRAYFGTYSMAGALLNEQPTTVTQPLDLTGLATGRLPLISQRAFSWTGTRFELQGMDATDPYQPGYPVLLPDVEAMDEVAARSGLPSDAGLAYGSRIGSFVAEDAHGTESGTGPPSPLGNWHGGLATAGTGAPLASDNQPSAATRNVLRQGEHYNWYTRDNAQAGGPVGNRADIFLSGTGQWASQTVPVAPRGQDQNSRLLFGNATGRVQLTKKDQLDALYSGSRIDLSDWTQPAAFEALLARPMAPDYNQPYGFSGVRENDRLDFLQAGWTRQMGTASGVGALQVRYGYSSAHLNTFGKETGQQSVTDLFTGVGTGATPLTNRGARTRQEIETAFLPGTYQWGGRQHRIAIGGGWERANITNRFAVPDNLNLITAAGVPDTVIEFNGSLNSQSRIQESSVYARDEIRLNKWLSVNIGVIADFARGSVPGQGSLIGWNSLSPHATLTLTPRTLQWLVLRGSYSRRYAPLAGQYLDFGNPQALSGQEYQWNDLNRDGAFQPNDAGMLLRRFGGVYSSISPSLARPYADEFDVSAEARLPFSSAASLQLFRRDEKSRLAAVNTGVVPQDFIPRTIPDPGPDGIPGTFDDAYLTVYDQDPATFGRDRFLLTNPAGLREEYEGFTAQLATRHRYLDFRASFTVEKSGGPTNPGESVLTNDPGVVGALYMDPNTLVNASGADFFDRDFIGKVITLSRLPARFGGLELDNVVDYFDGLVFARQILIDGLSQGPLVALATVRGSPEGGSRAEYVLNWNLRIARNFELTRGTLRVAADLLNAVNSNNRVQESPLSGTLFNQRLPVAIQPPRFIRLNVRFDF